MSFKWMQTHLGTGEALARLKAEASNPKTDIWWGGTGDPFLAAAGRVCLSRIARRMPERPLTGHCASTT